MVWTLGDDGKGKTGEEYVTSEGAFKRKTALNTERCDNIGAKRAWVFVE